MSDDSSVYQNENQMKGEGEDGAVQGKDDKPLGARGKVISSGGRTVSTEQQIERDVDFTQSPSPVADAQLALAEKEARENYDKYLRALAELENVKKRTAKERSDLLKYQGEKIFVDLLEVVDDFDRAMQSAKGDSETFRSGVELIHKRLMDTLSRWEIRGQSSIGQPFDPNLHMAISTVPGQAGVAPGTVVGEIKKLFYYRDKVLRHGEVVVSGKAEEEK